MSSQLQINHQPVHEHCRRPIDLCVKDVFSSPDMNGMFMLVQLNDDKRVLHLNSGCILNVGQIRHAFPVKRAILDTK